VTGPLLILGAGAMGRALAGALIARGLASEVHIWSRRPEAARSLATAVAGVHVVEDLEQAPDLDAALLAVKDAGLEEVAGALLTAGCAPPVVLHTSGYHDVEVLAALAGTSARGVLHPAAALRASGPPSTHRGDVFEGVRFGVSGEAPALELARRLATGLGGIALEVAGAERPLYHAAAALLSNGWVALFAEADALLAEALPHATAAERHGLALALARSTLANLADQAPEDGLAGALTGPVARGDEAVVRGHLGALAASGEPERAALYEQLVAAMRRLVARGEA